MAMPAYKNIKHSKIHPKFLHSNSTSHRWAFGAIAELIDNAMDPDVNATQFCIDMQQFNNETCLVFMDNGYGMRPDVLHKMLGFGHSDKKEVDGHRPIGFYGNGFKSGSMRLGRDALVLTKCNETMSVGFLSQTFLKAEGLNEILVPMITWDLDGYCLNPDSTEVRESLRAIIKYSVFQDEDSLLLQLDAIPECGTIIIISNLRRNGRQFELDFLANPHDIRISSDEPFEDDEQEGSQTFQQSRPAQPRGVDVPLDYSLRAYVNVLYKVPRMQIFIRNKKVKCQRITSVLRSKIHETYRPRDVPPGMKCEIEMGFNTENEDLYGMMLYHRNRLIKPYLRVGIQQEANRKGVGVLGVVEADFLQPTHNKQNFDNTKTYRAMINKLALMLKYFWYERVESVQRNIYGGEYALEDGETEQEGAERTEEQKQKEKEAEKIPDDLWVQCDFPKCLKWRRLPGGTDPSTLPEMWFCYLHPDPVVAEQSHSYPEEKYDGGRNTGMDEDGGFSLKDVKRKFEMHKKERKQKIEERESKKKEELEEKLAVAERAQRKLQQEKEEFEREKERERKRLMELEEQNKLLRERREANAESSDAAKKRKASEDGFGLIGDIDEEELGLPNDWEMGIALGMGREDGQKTAQQMQAERLLMGQFNQGEEASPSDAGRDEAEGLGAQEKSKQRVEGITPGPPTPRSNGRENGPPPGPASRPGDSSKRDRAGAGPSRMGGGADRPAPYPQHHMPQGQYPGQMGSRDDLEQQLEGTRNHLMSTCKRLRNCLLTMSRLAGLEEDGLALANLNPGDLMMLDTDSLCHKFSLTIMQRMNGGRMG